MLEIFSRIITDFPALVMRPNPLQEVMQWLPNMPMPYLHPLRPPWRRSDKGRRSSGRAGGRKRVKGNGNYENV